MAIDTRDKRSSAMNHKCPWRRHRPLADGSIDTPDRKHLARLYSGIAASAAEDIASIDYDPTQKRPEYTSRSRKPDYTVYGSRPEYTARKS